MNAEELMPYIEPIYRFCRKRLQSRYDAEDLAGDILCCLLEGSSASAIDSLNAYVWRVARNRYARWIDGRRRSVVLLSEDLPSAVCRDRRSDADAQAFERVFRFPPRTGTFSSITTSAACRFGRWPISTRCQKARSNGGCTRDVKKSKRG